MYIHMLLKFCDDFVQEKHLASKSSVEVDQSFSVTVGKVARSHQVISNIGIIYNILEKRFVCTELLIQLSLSKFFQTCFQIQAYHRI